MYPFVTVTLFNVSTDWAALTCITRINLDNSGLILFSLVGEFLFKVIERPRYGNVAVFGSDTLCSITNA